MLKHGILGLLNYGDMTGYEIMTVFRESLSHFWVAQTSQIYRELQALEKHGWIETTHIAQEGKPDKNLLSITAAGRDELLRWLREDTEQRPIRSPLLMKTFFRGECETEENIAFFKSLPEKATVFLRGSESAVSAGSKYEGAIDDPKKALYWSFTIRFGILYEQMLQAWCEECICALEAQRDKREA